MNTFNKQDEFSRRKFIEGLAASSLGVSLVSAADDKKKIDRLKASADHVIYLFMGGGMSHIDTFDVKPESPEIQGPVKAIKTNVSGIRLSEYLPGTAKQMDKLCVINSMTTTQGAHPQAVYYMQTNYPPRGTIAHPHMGSWVSHYLGQGNSTLPCNVKISQFINSQGAGYLHPRHGALPIGDPAQGLQNSQLSKGVSEKQMDKRLQALAKMNGEFQQKYSHLKLRAYSEMYNNSVKMMRGKDISAFDLSQEKKKTHEAYGDSQFGQGCLLARRLVEHGVKYIEVGFRVWDSHIANFDKVSANCKIMDKAYSALIADLYSRGMLKRTLVVLATEFGRTPEINTAKENGRDHHVKAFSCVLAGGGVKGGQVYGKSDKNGNEIIENKVTVEDFNATIGNALGLPINKEFTTSTGRPFTIAKKGKPVTEIF